jgi:hypothetical protein
MAAVTLTWDPTAPAGGANIKDGDDAIRNHKTSFVQRVNNGGHAWDATGGPTVVETDGRHSAGASNTAGSTELAGEFNIYAADKTTVIAVFRDSTAATPSELYLVANDLRTTGNVIAVDATFTGDVATGAITPTGHIIPLTDDLYDLGDATHRFANAWFSGTVTFEGAVAHSAIEEFSAGIAVTGGGVVINTSSYSTYRIVTSGTTALGAEDRVVIGKLTGNATVTLPAIATNDSRELFIALASGSFTLSVDPSGSELINGSATPYPLVLTGTGGVKAIHIICDAIGGWWILSTVTIG